MEAKKTIHRLFFLLLLRTLVPETLMIHRLPRSPLKLQPVSPLPDSETRSMKVVGHGKPTTVLLCIVPQ